MNSDDTSCCLSCIVEQPASEFHSLDSVPINKLLITHSTSCIAIGRKHTANVWGKIQMTIFGGWLGKYSDELES